ncbi:SusD/RagB family protein [Flavobacterium rivuli WB 3.3-2 = DSM 21788]|uniref:SusD/RagB family protein n=1 Tax=Flavobacterium rivuli WB 3.3-2 = DSM 21788 TaxID=1121895 RepID=A0A0A2MD78_9FLAO|nr:RagB/SusD family nutrient uptake outer membrane protein [Flavobacterium rivuli]KGO86235.1 SusD/RagB family protein [Flavobacterium rivuli WB 3.3-2 = DSM 21788]
MKKTILFISLLFAAVGCDDELNIANPNYSTTESFWQTEEHAVKGVNAIYNSFIVDGSYMRMTPALTDGRGDDFKGDSPWLDLVQVANFTILPTSGPITWMWSAYYQAIYRANQVIEYVPAIEMDEAVKARCIGQAHFLRGLAYFNLVTNYEKVPLITSVPTNVTEYYNATASNEQIWAQIIADFTAAQTMLPVSYQDLSGLDTNQIGRATKGAATGFLGKSYLYTQKWAQAAAEFNKLINGPELNVYSLTANYKDNFGPYTENNSESLFEIQFQTGSGTIKNYGGEPSSAWMQVSSVGHTYAMEGYGYSDFLPTRWIYDEYKQERTVDGHLDPRLLVSIASYEPSENSITVYNGAPWVNPQGNIYPRKYTHDGFGVSTESQGGVEYSEINYRLMRYADVLLMYAEALNEQGQTAQAYQYIQQVRSRANLPNLAVTRPGMSQSQMRDQLAHERALELSIESIRIHDIIRWGWLYNAEKLTLLKSHDSDFETWTPGKEYLPIPQAELDVNPNALPNSAN